MTGGSLPPSKTRPPARTSTVPVCSRRSRSRARSASICCSVRCHHCGRAYVGTSAHGRTGRYTYYACSTRYKYPLQVRPLEVQRRPASEGPPGGRRPRAARRPLARRTRHRESARRGRRTRRERTAAGRRTRRERTAAGRRATRLNPRREITRVEAKLERYFEAFEEGSLSPADCEDRVRCHRARAGQGTPPPARQRDPRTRPPPDHPHLQDSGGGSRNTS